MGSITLSSILSTFPLMRPYRPYFDTICSPYSYYLLTDIKDTLLPALEEARMIWEKIRDREKVIEKLKKLYGMVLDKELC